MWSQRANYLTATNRETLFDTHSPRRCLGSHDPPDLEPVEIFLFKQRTGCAARDLVGYGNARDRLRVAIVVRALVRPCLAVATSTVVVRERQLRASLWGWDDDA